MKRTLPEGCWAPTKLMLLWLGCLFLRGLKREINPIRFPVLDLRPLRARSYCWTCRRRGAGGPSPLRHVTGRGMVPLGIPVPSLSIPPTRFHPAGRRRLPFEAKLYSKSKVHPAMGQAVGPDDLFF